MSSDLLDKAKEAQDEEERAMQGLTYVGAFAVVIFAAFLGLLIADYAGGQTTLRDALVALWEALK